jgi:hypothetical protein
LALSTLAPGGAAHSGKHPLALCTNRPYDTSFGDDSCSDGYFKPSQITFASSAQAAHRVKDAPNATHGIKARTFEAHGGHLQGVVQVTAAEGHTEELHGS